MNAIVRTGIVVAQADLHYEQSNDWDVDDEGDNDAGDCLPIVVEEKSKIVLVIREVACRNVFKSRSSGITGGLDPLYHSVTILCISAYLFYGDCIAFTAIVVIVTIGKSVLKTLLAL